MTDQPQPPPIKSASSPAGRATDWRRTLAVGGVVQALSLTSLAVTSVFLPLALTPTKFALFAALQSAAYLGLTLVNNPFDIALARWGRSASRRTLFSLIAGKIAATTAASGTIAAVADLPLRHVGTVALLALGQSTLSSSSQLAYLIGSLRSVVFTVAAMLVPNVATPVVAAVVTGSPEVVVAATGVSACVSGAIACVMLLAVYGTDGPDSRVQVLRRSLREFPANVALASTTTGLQALIILRVAAAGSPSPAGDGRLFMTVVNISISLLPLSGALSVRLLSAQSDALLRTRVRARILALTLGITAAAAAAVVAAIPWAREVYADYPRFVSLIPLAAVLMFPTAVLASLWPLRPVSVQRDVLLLSSALGAAVLILVLPPSLLTGIAVYAGAVSLAAVSCMLSAYEKDRRSGNTALLGPHEREVLP